MRLITITLIVHAPDPHTGGPARAVAVTSSAAG